MTDPKDPTDPFAYFDQPDLAATVPSARPPVQHHYSPTRGRGRPKKAAAPSSPAVAVSPVSGGQPQPADPRAPWRKKIKGVADPTPENFWAHDLVHRDWSVTFEDDTPLLYQWSGKYWRPLKPRDIAAEAERYMDKFFNDKYSPGKIDACVEITETKLVNLGRELVKDSDRALFSTRSGYLEILVDGSIKVTKHDKKCFVRDFVDVELDPSRIDADGFYTPRSNEEIESGDSLFSRLVTNSFGDLPMRRAFQEHFGDLMLPMNSQVTTFLVGNGGQGKSQWSFIVSKMMGNSLFVNLDELQGFNLEAIMGKSLLIVDETKKKIDEQSFKRIFGGGVPIAVQRKFKSMVNWQPDVKGFCSVNSMPSFSEHSNGVDRRIRPFPMTKAMHNAQGTVKDIGKKIVQGYKVPGVARGQEVTMPHEKALVLDWMLNGAVEVAKRGRLMNEDELPHACQVEKNNLRVETDPVFAFVEELQWEPVKGAGGVTKMEIYKVYVEWAQANGRTGILSSTSFGKDLKRTFDNKYGAGMLKEGKIEVVGGFENGIPLRAWKPAFKCTAKNGADYKIKYQDFEWNNEEKRDNLEPVSNVTNEPLLDSGEDINF